jgi:hypothetical protein
VRNFFQHHPRLALSLAGASLLSLGFVGGAAAQLIGIGEGWLLPSGQSLYDAEMLMDLTVGGNSDTVMLQGPTIIRTGGPEPAPGGGAMYDTEILQMDLQGSSEILGPVRVRLSPTSASQGMIKGTADPDGDVLYPADSFFDVFFEVEVEGTAPMTLHAVDALRLQGQASDENLPDDEHRTTSSVSLLDENNEVQGQIGSVRFVPKPPLERKVSRVMVKKLNKVMQYVLDLQAEAPFPPPPPPPEVLVASKSLKVTIPRKGEFVVGVPTAFQPVNERIENPFKRDANVKICVDATRIEKGQGNQILLTLDVAGDGDFRPHSFVEGKDLKLIKNTCFIVATREFLLFLRNHEGESDVPAEIAIIWTTGQVIP